jgi:hypothetical protein
VIVGVLAGMTHTNEGKMHLTVSQAATI